MGNDQLFKRRAKTKADYERREIGRQPNKRILIVCEGTRTERGYFDPVIKSLGITGIDVVIRDDCGSAPISVVRHAEAIVKSEGSFKSGGYNYVFCVFDRDSHDTFEAAKSKIESLNRSLSGSIERMCAITSIPCIEYWFVLHNAYTRSPYAAVKGKSVGDLCVEELKRNKVFEKYEKKLSSEQIHYLIDNLQKALRNSRAALSDSKDTGEENPSTRVHEMFDFLEEQRLVIEKEKAKSNR
ncbi:RloB family protein [Asticcacaulis sp. AC460]|uniref:RloB family protein n=1 Tax=Asticcacaulis sp. AC460 TaxID=1282360 RepID=UPI0009DD9BAA|nr:RloB family protein [Asticcacaulis sp. AC460]